MISPEPQTAEERKTKPPEPQTAEESEKIQPETQEEEERKMISPEHQTAEERKTKPPEPQTAEERKMISAENQAAEERKIISAETPAAEERKMISPEPQTAEERKMISAETPAAEERKMISPEPQTAEESEKIQTETQEEEERKTKYQLYESIGKYVLDLEVMSTNTTPFNYFNCGILEISFKSEILMTISLTSSKCYAKKRMLKNNWKGDLDICLKFTDQEWKFQEQNRTCCMTKGTTIIPLYFDVPNDNEQVVQFTITMNITKWTTDVEYQTSPRLCNAESKFVLERKKVVSNVLQQQYGFGKKNIWRFVRGLPMLMYKDDGIKTGSGIASAMNLADEPDQKTANDAENDRIPAPEREMAANPERIEAGGDLMPALNLAEEMDQMVVDGGGGDGVFPAEGEKVNPLEVPIIAVIGSGGGMRAVIGMGGAMTGLQKHGILDITMFTAGLSGSAWYLLALYADDSDGLDPVKVNKHIAENLSSFKSVCMAWNLLKYFIKRIIGDHGKYFSATHIFGKMIGRLLLRRGQHTWSEQTMKIKQKNLPMPLVAALHVRDETTIADYHEWVEFTPYKVTIEEYGTSINMTDFGSEFADGKLIKRNREPPIHYLQGICGSAYAIVREYRHKVYDRVQPVLRLLGLVILRYNSLAFNCTLRGHNLGQIVLMSNILGFECNLIVGFARYFYRKLFRCVRVFIRNMFNIFDALCIAKVPNFIRGTQLRRIDDVKHIIDIDKEYMMLVDAGLLFNSPYPLVLHPDREVDVIISFDWSDRGKDAEWPFGELEKAHKWARSRKCVFPWIHVELDEIREQWQTIKKEMYIFKGFGAPTIIHFVMINIENGFRILPEYNTLKFGYTMDEFERFNSLVQRIVCRNMKEIQECIGRATYMRKFKNVMKQLLENIQMVE